jgi:hypothetical protein
MFVRLDYSIYLNSYRTFHEIESIMMSKLVQVLDYIIYFNS